MLVAVTLLSEKEIDAGLASGVWHREGEAIVRECKLQDFGEAIAFVNRVADAAESAGHHPDILLHSWNRVRLELSTHSEGGLTRADFEMAARIDELA
jgi:4a-hydroxytetrahydrobiopterin dehydratase